MTGPDERLRHTPQVFSMSSASRYLRLYGDIVYHAVRIALYTTSVVMYGVRFDSENGQLWVRQFLRPVLTPEDFESQPRHIWCTSLFDLPFPD